MVKKRVIARGIFLVVLLAGTLAAMPVAAERPRPQHGMGCLPSPPGDYPVLDMDAPVRGQSLASAVDLSYGLPPVADQGMEPTCTLWAVAYYYKTFQEQREWGWDVSNADHQFSPSFLYSLSTDCAPLQPVAIPTAMELVKSLGCATLATFPLLTYNTCRMPTAEELQKAWPFRASSYGNLFMHPGNADIYRLKSHLAGGDPFVLSIPVYDSFYFYDGEPPVIGLPTASERLWGHHAVLIVGYDDNLRAFKFINSWGTRWGQEGYGYLSYDFVRAKAWEAWAMVDASTPHNVLTPTPTTTPTMTATPEPTATTTPVTDPTVTPTPTETPLTNPTATPTPTVTPSPSPSPDAPDTEAHTLVLQRSASYAGVTDTYIESRQPRANYDWSQSLRVSDDGSVASLLRFDLSTVPAMAEIVEATLKLYVVLDAHAGQNISLACFEVRRPWISKEAHWRRARKEHPWGKPGCNDVLNDRAADAVSTQTIKPGKGWYTIDVTAAVRDWVSDRSSNHGLLLRGQGTTKAVCSFFSSEYWSADMRPQLIIKYR